MKADSTKIGNTPRQRTGNTPFPETAFDLIDEILGAPMTRAQRTEIRANVKSYENDFLFEKEDGVEEVTRLRALDGLFTEMIDLLGDMQSGGLLELKFFIRARMDPEAKIARLEALQRQCQDVIQKRRRGRKGNPVLMTLRRELEPLFAELFKRGRGRESTLDRFIFACIAHLDSDMHPHDHTTLRYYRRRAKRKRAK